MTDSATLSVQQLTDLRKRVLKGEEISDEEVGKVLHTLRSERASIGAAKAKKSTTRKPVDLASLFPAKK